MDILDMVAVKSPKWMEKALCADADPELFFPDPHKDPPPRYGDAIKICMRCPVRQECLNWAFEIDDEHAILGGKTRNQRSRDRRKNGKMPHLQTAAEISEG